jgi:hypothetical protein
MIEMGQYHVYGMKANYMSGSFILGAKFLQYYYSVHDMNHSQIALLQTKYSLENNLVPQPVPEASN